MVTPQIVWQNEGSKGYLRNPPKGWLLNALFSDWRKGTLRDEVASMIEGEYPDTEALSKWLCGELCGASCYIDIEVHRRNLPQAIRGGSAPGPRRPLTPSGAKKIAQRIRIQNLTRNDGPSELQSRLLEPAMWKVASNHVRRAIVILAILGEKGMRKGGYHYSDLRRISGVWQNGPTERLIKSLIDLGYLTKTHTRNPRYTYKVLYSHDYGPAKREDMRMRLHEEIARNEVRDLAKFLKGASAGHPRHRFVEGSDFAWIDPGILVGSQPPLFAEKLIGEISQIVMRNLFDGFNGVIDRAIDKRASGDEDAYDRETDGAVLNDMMSELEPILESLNKVTQEQAKEWETYWRNCRSGKIRSVLAYDMTRLFDLASR